MHARNITLCIHCDQQWFTIRACSCRRRPISEAVIAAACVMVAVMAMAVLAAPYRGQTLSPLYYPAAGRKQIRQLRSRRCVLRTRMAGNYHDQHDSATRMQPTCKFQYKKTIAMCCQQYYWQFSGDGDVNHQLHHQIHHLRLPASLIMLTTNTVFFQLQTQH